MIKIFSGLKGSGKTKHLIEKVNSAAEVSHGNVICIEKGNKLIHEIKYNARLVDTDIYHITKADSLYGFVSGILAGNYDITDIFIDSALKICENDVSEFEKFILHLIPILEKSNANLTVTASIETEKLPESLKAFL